MKKIDQKWLENRVKYIQALKAPNAIQQALIELYSLNDRTRDQQQDLEKLIIAEKNAYDDDTKSIKQKRKASEESEKKRKQRAHQLIKLGALVEMAGLLDADPALILGALLEINEMSDSKKADLAQNGMSKLNKKTNVN